MYPGINQDNVDRRRIYQTGGGGGGGGPIGWGEVTEKVYGQKIKKKNPPPPPVGACINAKSVETRRQKEKNLIF